MGKLMSVLKKNTRLYAFCYRAYVLACKPFSDEMLTKIKYKKHFGRTLDLQNPKRFTEKIQWLKLYERNDFQTLCADKYEARKYIAEKFGEEILIPLLYQTDDWREIKLENMPDEPFVLKSNNGSGTVKIIRDKHKEDWGKLQKLCKFWLSANHYETSQEWQYKNMKPCIICEKLMTTNDGKLPFDYKLHFFNGKLEFVYCSVDREGKNNRNIYDAEWNPLYFALIRKSKYRDDLRGAEIECPQSFEQMKKIGEEIAKNFKCVRVDFYDVDGKLYMGEITLHHGSGFDSFFPDEYDVIYGEKLDLGNK